MDPEEEEAEEAEELEDDHSSREQFNEDIEEIYWS